MKPDGLEPGMYLVGRDDGSQTPFFVRVGEAGSRQPYSKKLHLATIETGGWWRRMEVPWTLPDQDVLDSMSRFPMLRGK